MINKGAVFLAIAFIAFFYLDWVNKKRFMHLAGFEINSVKLILNTEMLIYQSKVISENLSVKVEILFSKFTHRLDAEIMKMLVRGMFAKKDPTFHFGP